MEILSQTPPHGELIRLNPGLLNPTTPPVPTPEPRIWVIAWHRVQGGPGKGCGKKRFTRTDADALCAELNRDYKHIEHRVEKV